MFRNGILEELSCRRSWLASSRSCAKRIWALLLDDAIFDLKTTRYNAFSTLQRNISQGGEHKIALTPERLNENLEMIE